MGAAHTRGGCAIHAPRLTQRCPEARGLTGGGEPGSLRMHRGDVVWCGVRGRRLRAAAAGCGGGRGRAAAAAGKWCLAAAASGGKLLFRRTH
eukprot:gene21149-biopygen1088